jgi:hypothetical protein
VDWASLSGPPTHGPGASSWDTVHLSTICLEFVGLCKCRAHLGETGQVEDVIYNVISQVVAFGFKVQTLNTHVFSGVESLVVTTNSVCRYELGVLAPKLGIARLC